MISDDDFTTVALGVTQSTPDTRPLHNAPLMIEVSFSARGWTPAAVRKLIALARNSKSVPAIASEMSYAPATIRKQLLSLGIWISPSRRQWTEGEDAELHRSYGLLSSMALGERIGRTAGAVKARAVHLGLSAPASMPYSTDDEELIRHGYSSGIPICQIASALGRSGGGIATHASKNGLLHAKAPARWKESEIAAALELAKEGLEYREIAARLSNVGGRPRSKNAVQYILSWAGYSRFDARPWLREEDDYLRAVYKSGRPLQSAAVSLSRSIGQIRTRCSQLSLTGTHPSPYGFRRAPGWTDEENELLRSGYGRAKTRDIATQLGRSPCALIQQAKKLGLTHGRSRLFSAEEEDVLKAGWAVGYSSLIIAAALGRDVAVLARHAKMIGLTFSGRKNRVRKAKKDCGKLVTAAEILRHACSQGFSPPSLH